MLSINFLLIFGLLYVVIIQSKHYLINNKYLIEVEDNNKLPSKPEGEYCGSDCESRFKYTNNTNTGGNGYGNPDGNGNEKKKCKNGVLKEPGYRKMGFEKGCDVGDWKLEVDWDPNDSKPYTCTPAGRQLKPKWRPSEMTCDDVPEGYAPPHYCMQDCIYYEKHIPTYEGHRPNWAVWGEYVYIPRQRWLHNVEHGTVVMLYHPCADPKEVDKLRKIVSVCLRKHLITPDITIPEETPLVLVAWGCRLLMTEVDEDTVVNFIREKGLKGPEGYLPKDGIYKAGLLKATEIKYGDGNDTSFIACPQYKGPKSYKPKYIKY